MFTGLITGVGTVRRLTPIGAGQDMRIGVAAPWPDTGSIPLGASIACSGCCLTAVVVTPDSFEVEASAETLSRTNLGGWAIGSRINLERSLRLGDELGGHLVSGHVDGLGTVEHVTPENGSWRLGFSVPPALARFIAQKGSVAIDGVSLTVNEVRGTRFGVNIIPHTWQATTLGQLAPGQPVHIEIDMLARYVARLAEADAEAHGGGIRVRTASLNDYLTGAADIIEEARAGRMFVLVDDEDRENEGDLVIPAQFATPDAINFMARHARGLICLAMTRHRVEQLGLPLMSQSNGSRHQTAFTVSIEAREGVTTGISAADRARTIAVAINAESGRDAIATPGHVFPLMAREGGTLVRAGHTEAAVDIARLAGLAPAGVICEIMNDDGTMARLPELAAFAQHHNLKLGTIADLIAHRRRTERLVKRVQGGNLHHAAGGDWDLHVYSTTLERAEHLVLTKGDLAAPGPVMVRMHAVDIVNDALGTHQWSALHGAMRMIAEEGRGAVVLIRDTRPDAVSARVKLLEGNPRPLHFLRDYGIGAQILTDLGIRDMILLSNTRRTLVGLEGYGLNIVDQRPIEGAPQE